MALLAAFGLTPLLVAAATWWVLVSHRTPRRGSTADACRPIAQPTRSA